MMMVFDIDGVLVKSDLLTSVFTCDLPRCLGKCCVVGDSGAPVTDAEIKAIGANYNQVKSWLKPDGIKAIENYGIAYTDEDGDQVLALIEGRECAFSYKEGSVHKCGIEAAWFSNRSGFRKPLSCHLYPVRVEETEGKELLVYERNMICEAGRKHGKETGTPLYLFLKDALIRAYGIAWFEKLEYAAKNLDNP